MNRPSKKQRKKKKAFSKPGVNQDLKSPSNDILSSSFDLSVKELEKQIDLKLFSNTEQLKNSISRKNSNSILVSADESNIVLSKENLFFYESMKTSNDFTGFFEDKDLNIFDFYSNSYCFNDLSTEEVNQYVLSFSPEYEKQNEFVNLSKIFSGFSSKDLKGNEKLSFGRNPNETFLKSQKRNGEDSHLTKKIKDIILNFPVFVTKNGEENIQLDTKNIFDTKIERKTEFHDFTPVKAKEEHQKENEDISKEFLFQTRTNETETDSKSDKEKLFKLEQRKINVTARKKICNMLGENYTELINSKEGKNKLKSLIRNNQRKFRIIKQEVRYNKKL